MKKRSGFLFVGALMAATLWMGGCSKLPELSAILPAPSAATGKASDISVTKRVKLALDQNASLKLFDIAVETLKGDVRLSGMLDSQAQVDLAIKITRALEGVHSIHDELTIKQQEIGVSAVAG